MKAYISGPMTGIDDYNYGSFASLCRELRAAGYDVFDPTELFGGRTDLPWEHYMRACLPGVFGCQRVFALRGWESSVGARVEIAAALSAGIPVYEHDPLVGDWVKLEGGRDGVAKIVGVTVNRI